MSCKIVGPLRIGKVITAKALYESLSDQGGGQNRDVWYQAKKRKEIKLYQVKKNQANFPFCLFSNIARPNGTAWRTGTFEEDGKLPMSRQNSPPAPAVQKTKWDPADPYK